ncbi:hypothetical protein D1007_06799 [Hordeum vulgare]|nr:hypothetical protein D1007_06799 [Hordeum vulgare]
MPRPLARRLPHKSLTHPPNNNRRKPWCTKYSHDLKENLAVEKQIVAACTDEAMMATMRADPQILEENLTIEATTDASRTNTTTWLDAITNSSWSFLKGTTNVLNEDYEVFSQCARAFLTSTADMLVLGQDHATHHYVE